MQAGDPHIVDALDANAEQAGGFERLLRYRPVGGAGGYERQGALPTAVGGSRASTRVRPRGL